MKLLLQRLILGMVAVAVLVGGVVWYRHYDDSLHKVTYVTRAATKGDVSETVSCTGTIQPIRTIQVGSQVSGIIKKLYVDFNSVVKKNQLMALVDPRPLLEQKKQAQFDLDNAHANLQSQQANLTAAVENEHNAVASLATAQAGVDSARVSVQNAEAQLDSARGNERKARAQLDVDQLTFQRNQGLRAKDLIAQADLDTSRATYLEDQAALSSAVAGVRSAEANLKSAQVALVSSQTQVTQAVTKQRASAAQVSAAQDAVVSANAQVGKSSSLLDEANVNVEYSRIVAPVDGIVIARSVDQGQTIASALSAPTLFTLGTDLKKMQIDANVDESDMARVKVGQDATFTVDAYPDQEFDAEVFQVRNAPTTVNNVVTYDVMLHVDNTDMRLKPGMTANLDLIVKESDDVLLVPNIALRFRPDTEEAAPRPSGSPHMSRPSSDASGEPAKHRHQHTHGRVYVLENGAPVAHPVRLGVTDGTSTEVLEGLKPGDAVIVGTEGAKTTAPGAPPMMVPAAPAAPAAAAAEASEMVTRTINMRVPI